MDSLEALEKLVQLSVSDNKLSAYFDFGNLEGSELQITEDLLFHFIQANGIKYGIQSHVVSQIIDKPALFNRSRVQIAIGEEPQDGLDGKIVFAFNLKNKGPRPQETEDGRVDYKEITQLNNVQQGQLIATREPSLPGRVGKDVFGQEIPFKPGKEAKFKVGKNVVVTGDNTAMYAAIDGLVTITDKGKLNVFPVYEINGDIDYSIGNINFVGTVVVRGNVLSGFKIIASGDIRVTGGVEGAELEADGSIEIHGGIIGYNKGRIKAGYNVKSSFIQDGNIEAGQDVIVSQSIMHSNIKAGRDVICNGPKGLIVGGHIQAGETVTARTIGNTMSTNTTVEVGVLPELRNELSALRAQLREMLSNLDKTEKALVLLDQLASQGKLTADKLTLRSKLALSKKTALKEQNEVKERILEIEKNLEDTGKSKVMVTKTIYGGSKIVIGRYTKFVKDPVSRISFLYTDGDISMSANL